MMNHVFEFCLLFGGLSLLFFSDHPPEYGFSVIFLAFVFASFIRILGRMMKDM